jgi:hypothetical protein
MNAYDGWAVIVKHKVTWSPLRRAARCMKKTPQYRSKSRSGQPFM